MPRFSLLPRSTSTPARAYAFFFFVMSSEVETSLFLILTARDLIRSLLVRSASGLPVHVAASPAAPFSTPLRSARNDKQLFQIREQGRMCFLIGERFGAVLAFFHNELVQCRVNGQGIISIETGQAKAIHRFSRRPYHAFHIEVTEAVDTEVFADVSHRHLVRNQLIRIRKIDAVVTSKPVRRTAYAHVHFFGASFAQGHYARSRGRPPYDRVVHNHDPFSGHHFLDQIQLYPHIEIADKLARLQKRSANVVIADKGVGIRNV